MIHIRTNDNWSLESLGSFLEPVEIAAENGELVGLFVPANLERARELFEGIEKLRDADELDRIAATEQTGSPLREVLTHLEALDGSSKKSRSPSHAAG